MSFCANNANTKSSRWPREKVKRGRSKDRPRYSAIYSELEDEADTQTHGARVLEEEGQAVPAILDYAPLRGAFGCDVITRQELLDVDAAWAAVLKFQVLIAACERIR